MSAQPISPFKDPSTPGIRTWVIRHTDSGGLETKFDFAGGLADSTETEKQGTIEHRNGKNKVPLDVIACRETTHAPVVAALGAESTCNSMSSLL